MLRNVGAKFIGRSVCLWGGEAALPQNLARVKQAIPKVHAADPDLVLQACIFEIVTTQVDQVPVPDWAFNAVGLRPETRNFRYADMLYPSGRFKDHWPGSRTLASPKDQLRWYRANLAGAATPDGWGDEETIKAIWATHPPGQ